MFPAVGTGVPDGPAVQAGKSAQTTAKTAKTAGASPRPTSPDETAKPTDPAAPTDATAKPTNPAVGADALGGPAEKAPQSTHSSGETATTAGASPRPTSPGETTVNTERDNAKRKAEIEAELLEKDSNIEKTGTVAYNTIEAERDMPGSEEPTYSAAMPNGSVLQNDNKSVTAAKKEEIDETGSPIFAKTREEAKIEPVDFSGLREIRKSTDVRFGIEKEEAGALSGYIQLTYGIINSKLLSGNVDPVKDQPGIDRLMAALKKFPVFDGRTYRNIAFKGERSQQKYRTFLEEYVEGNTVELKAFTSSSKRPNGRPLFGEYVVHIVIDGAAGADIADTYGLPRQQEVILLPGTNVKVTRVTTANDGHPLIYVQEVKWNETGGNLENQRSSRSVESNREDGGRLSVRSGGTGDGIRGDAWRDSGGNGVLSQRRTSSGRLTGEEAPNLAARTPVALSGDASAPAAPDPKANLEALRKELDDVDRRLFALGLDGEYGPEPANTKEGQSLLDRKAALEAEIAEAEKALAKDVEIENAKSMQNAEVDSDTSRQYTENGKGSEHPSNDENTLLAGYQASIEQGKLSPMVSFELYKKYYDEVQTIIGTKVGDAEITGQSQHFLERVFGCASDPKTGKPRNGVAIEDVLDCLKNPVEIWPVRESISGKSFVVVGKRAKISVNPDTGKLIQINPRR